MSVFSTPFIQTGRCRRASQGMVLFEVVIALFIFTMVAFSLVMALDRTFDAAMERNEIDVALRGLDNQLTLLHAGQLQTGENNAPDDGSGVLYHLSIQPEQMRDQKGNLVPNMYRATITATWKSHDGGHPNERDVTELIYQP
jgi:type II secretory pathway component PulJ